MLEKIDAVINRNKQSGYASRVELIEDAIETFLKKCAHEEV